MRWRRAAARILLACWLFAWSCAAPALDPALDIEQYAHSAWRVREGFGRGQIHVIAQTPDGYLWLGTDFGLFRFDGVRNTAWQPPKGQTLPGISVTNLLVGRDGRLWIASYGGLSSWHDGKLTIYPKLSGWSAFALREDSEGTLWVTARISPSRAVVCSVRSERVDCEGEDGRLGDWLGGMYVDRAGRVWITNREGVWRWRPGPPQFFKVDGIFDSLQCMSEDDDGALLLATRDGLLRLPDGKFILKPIVVGPREPRTIRMLRDRDGAFWVGSDVGITHLHRGRVDTFAPADGLSSEYIGRIFEDREGNIWVATRDGLDRFRNFAISTFGEKQGLSNNGAGSLLAARDGGLWISTAIGLDRWRDGEFIRYRGRASNPRDAREVVVPGMSDHGATLFEDHRGRLWVGTDERLGLLESGRWKTIEEVPAGYIDAISEDPTGNIWIAHRAQGLVRISPQGELTKYAWDHLGSGDVAFRMAIDPRGGGIWLGFLRGGIARVVDGRVDARYSDADGLGPGRVYFMGADPDGTVWVGSAGGLSRVKDGRVARLDHASGLPCDQVDWIMKDADDAWIDTSCGLMRSTRKEFEDWFAAAPAVHAPRVLRGAVFSDSDGHRSATGISSYSPHVARTPDGRIWFASIGGVGVVDPKQLVPNPLLPPVHIEGLIADRVAHELSRSSTSLQLPPLIRDLQIDYTALSLVAPEKMQFRYRLEGHDPKWQNAGTRRAAFYTDLAPGDYRFQVIASNNDGVWNERGASLPFTIAPTFYQTRWFIAACVAAFLLVLWILYAMRVRQIESRVQMRLEERVAERERIARDLHDTFLQSVQGLILKFHAAMTRMPQEVPSRQLMEQALERADAVVTEGRNRVFGLRDNSQILDLPQALTEVAKEFSHVADTAFRLTVQGAVRKLHPLVREEAFRIGAEALVNAFRHAKARRIDVEIEYSRRELCLRVNDDGRGFDVHSVDTAAGAGHFGLTGLRERAHKIRAQVQVSSRVGSGSAVELRVPGAIAYATPRQLQRLLPQ